MKYKTTVIRTLAAMSAVGFLALTPQKASADYCRNIPEHGMRSCGFVTLEQCEAMVLGRTGYCEVNPFPGKAAAHHPTVVTTQAELKVCQSMKMDCVIAGRSAFAYLPKRGAAHRAK